MSRLSYKDSIAVDSGRRVILDCLAITGSADEGALILKHLENIKSKFGIAPREVSADSKYGTEHNYKELAKQRIEAFIPSRSRGGNTATGLFPVDKFQYNKKRDVIICPAKKVLRPRPYLIEDKYRLFESKMETCLTCPLLRRCTKIGKRRKTGRTVSISINKKYVDRAMKRVRSLKGREANNIRKTRTETLFGEAKLFHGLRRARWRGMIKVHIQFLLTSVVQNIKRIVKYSVGKKRRGGHSSLPYPALS